MASAADPVVQGEPPYRATELWREVIHRFRSRMPTGRRRVKMRVYEECFSGSEAVDWLLQDLQTSGLFGSVARYQVVTLLAKFLMSDVIEDVRERDMHQFEDGPHLYRFVQRPGPFNFLDDMEEGGDCGTTLQEGRSRPAGTCFANACAFTDDEGIVSCLSPEKLGEIDRNTCQPMTPSQVTTVWKELTLARLLSLVDLPSLDRVLSHSAVDGKQIMRNVNGGRLLPGSQQHQIGTENEAAEDIPSWVVMAFKCLSKWPEGCVDSVGALPIYSGFERDVLDALSSYFSQLPQPLISSKLYDLHMAVLPLVDTGDSRAVSALQLCSLLLPQSNRIRLHRVLRFIKKAAGNSSLSLSHTVPNRRVLLDVFSQVVLHPERKRRQAREDADRLVWFMCQHYRHIFKIPTDLKLQVEQRLSQHRQHKGQEGPLVRVFCQQVSEEKYREQMKETSKQQLAQLLDSITADENMSTKLRKQRLKQFQKLYPEIYAAKFSISPSSRTKSTSKR